MTWLETWAMWQVIGGVIGHLIPILMILAGVGLLIVTRGGRRW